MNGRWRAQGAPGFTLVELLVSLVILALISTALFTALRFSARSWRAGESRLVDASDQEAVRRFLRMRLAEAVPQAMPTGGREREMVFRGDAEHVRFAAPMPYALGLGGTYVFTLAPGEAAPLQLDWLLLRPDRLLDVADGRVRPRPLFAAGIRAVRFRYFGSIDGRSAPGWTEIWESEALPRLVEIRFEGKQGRTAPPPIRVAIAAAS